MATAKPAVLVINSGSSSIKFKVYLGEEPLLGGQVEGLGTTPRLAARSANGEALAERALSPGEGGSHEAALGVVIGFLSQRYGDLDIAAVGHRVVHGGIDYAEPILVTETVLAALSKLCSLAPLHQPHNLAGIRAAIAAFPGKPQVACFDTAFHRHHPWVNDTFALPRAFFEEGVRRYGFHGLSYEFITGRLKEVAPEIAEGRVVVAHLGNGASMCAIRDGRSVGSTMGFSALDGLPMGTRCGQLDPGVILYLLQEKGMNGDEIADLLYHESGLKGLSSLTSDMRALEASDDPAAKQAIDYFVFRIRRELGAMAAILGGIDGLVFTGGIGENSALIRSLVCRDLGWIGIDVDEAANKSGATCISGRDAATQVLVLKTDEERMIARHTLHLISS
ncbi:acetate/propionate family kinase [Stappia sp. F7233]|uniref:Acetate kinase n=1 Tax=Stappia albiluteola TaxID=2758565 RepID=A0A839A9E1_9HYPH|nr:acetate/propionate family kinase [Stappia albiluteola]MBA5776240.1 acetate/propionate family kinase [Stappia albiluteola]